LRNKQEGKQYDYDSHLALLFTVLVAANYDTSGQYEEGAATRAAPYIHSPRLS
jgi:hypothetical protein